MVRIAVVALGALAAAAQGQQPPFRNARIETLDARGGLEAALREAARKQAGPAWIGYAVPAQAGMGQSCCWNGAGRGCGLEGQRHVQAERPEAVKLEGSTHMAILFRMENGAAGKIAAYAVDCPLDAGGLPVDWLTGATEASSIAVLERYARGSRQDGKKLADGAVFAIAVHRGPEADAALERLATAGPELETRRNAVFWLGNARGRRGYEVVSKVAREDPDDKLREHAIFALTQSKEPEAVSTIIGIAKQDRSAHVRGQALFWMAQMASKKAEEAIGESLRNDPDTEVKKAAVFALTQLPDNRGVPVLIDTATHNGNAAVRKQAMFWLGQSKDERALRFLEEVLTR